MNLDVRIEKSLGWRYTSESHQGIDNLLLASFNPMRKFIIPILSIKKLKFRK